MKDKNIYIKDNARTAKCSITGIKCAKGTAYMIPVPACEGGKAISKEYFEQFLATGKASGRICKAQKASEPHDIQMEFIVNVPAHNIETYALYMLVNGWDFIGKVNKTAYRVKPTNPFITCRGLQQAMTTFDNINADNGVKISKFTCTVDGVVIPKYEDSFTFYQQVDETCKFRKTTIRENRLQELNIKKGKGKKK